MIKGLLTGFIASILFVSLIANSVPAFSQGNESPGKPEVIAVTGFIPGKDLIVHILVEVQPGETRNEAAIAALAHQGARPITHAEYTLISIKWDQFFDSDSGNDKVVQRYNTANDRSGIDIGNPNHPFIKSQNSWTNVASSSFVFEFGGTTKKCPSLVQECRGPQKFDGFNDVAWMKLNSPSTLGVTWTGTSTDEADMALNTSFDWSTDNPATYYDIETVFLHEGGHALGLGHENDVPSIMASYYSTINRVLYQDDIDGITYLYPADPNASSAILTGIAISPADGQVDVGSSIQFTATASYDDNTTGDITNLVSWISSNTTAATISSTGLAAGIAEGSVTITANYDEKTDNTNLIINPAQETQPPGSLLTDITPSQKQKGPHTDVSFTVKVTDGGVAVSDILINFNITRSDPDREFLFSGTTDSSGSVKFTVMKALSATCYTGTIINWSSFDPSGKSSDINCTS